jgi:hypothetical protein
VKFNSLTMKSIVLFMFITFGLISSGNGQTKIEVKTNSQEVNAELGIIDLKMAGGEKPYSVYLYKFKPSFNVVKEIKGTTQDHLVFENLSSDFYFIHVKDASGKLTISNPIDLKEKLGKKGGNQ